MWYWRVVYDVVGSFFVFVFNYLIVFLYNRLASDSLFYTLTIIGMGSMGFIARSLCDNMSFIVHGNERRLK